jgi:hypothetical protein
MIKKKMLVCLTEKEVEFLRMESEKQGISMSDIIRRLIDKYREELIIHKR